MGKRKTQSQAKSQNMSKEARELSAVALRRLKHPGYHAAGGAPSLHLQVTSTGVRSWILPAQVVNARRDIGLGGYPEISLVVYSGPSESSIGSSNPGSSFAGRLTLVDTG